MSNGAGVLSRLKVSNKLAILLLIAVVAVLIPTVLYVNTLRVYLDVAERSASSQDVNRSLLQLVRHTQTSRGLAAGVLAGNAAQRPALLERGQLVTREYQSLLGHLAAVGASAELVAQAEATRTAWAEISRRIEASGSGTPLTGAESFALHTQLVKDQMLLIDSALDYFGLSLEPNPDLYFLTQGALVHSPWITEFLGQMRGLGNGLLVAGSVSPEARTRMSVILEGAQTRTADASRQAQKALGFNPEFQQALGSNLTQSGSAIRNAIELARTQFLGTAAPTMAPADYFRETTAAIDAVFAAIDASIEQIDRQLEVNVGKAQTTLTLALAAVAVLLVFLVVFAYLIIRSIVAPLNQAIALAQEVAAGNLTGPAYPPGRNETAQLLHALSLMKRGLADVVSKVRGNAASVASASGEISMGSQDLSQRTESQASNLEETAASMEELVATVDANSATVQEARTSANSAAGVAQAAGVAVGAVVRNMEAINRSSGKIGDIIAVIDGIAFQTNILALNAAVEAARAGEAGRGFAVVASEVRSLAQRSAEAAKEIKALIQNSVQNIESGTRQVEEAERTVMSVVESMSSLAVLMDQVGNASAEQKSGLFQVTQAIGQIDENTQHNAALVEETAAAAASLRQQSELLVEAVGMFRLPHHAG